MIMMMMIIIIIITTIIICKIFIVASNENLNQLEFKSISNYKLVQHTNINSTENPLLPTESIVPNAV
jgi:hypothetical protein